MTVKYFMNNLRYHFISFRIFLQKKRFLSCSNNELNFDPATGDSVVNGVYEATSSTNLTGVNRDGCRTTARTLANSAKLTTAIDDDYSFLIIVCPSVVDFEGYISTALVNGGEAWFLDTYASFPITAARGELPKNSFYMLSHSRRNI